MRSSPIWQTLLPVVVAVAVLVSSGCANRAPEAELSLETDPTLAAVGTEIWLSAAGSQDPDGDGLEFSFDIAVNGLPEPTAWVYCQTYTDKHELCFIPTAPGSYVVTATVEDKHGSTATSEPVAVVVQPQS